MVNVVLKSAGSKMKLIFINGVKQGAVHLESHDIHIGLGTWKKERLWSGNFVFNNKTVLIGRTEKASAIKTKIERLIASDLARETA